MSKFQQIAFDLTDKIQSGYYPSGSYLPGEHVLAEDYQVSRETIRKAQKTLSDKGYIQKQKGKGALVLDHERFSFPISGLTSYKELQTEQGFSSQTEVIINETVKTPSFLLGVEAVSADEKFIHLVRCRYLDGQREIVDEDYLRLSVVGQIPNHIAQDSIYDYFEEKLGLNIAYATKEIIATPTNDMDQNLLGLEAKDHVIQVNSYVYLEDARFFQYTSSHHRLEKFRFAEFARRSSSFMDKD
ncbi:trehalose operon repressor [Aerococcus kribbianus]|uniref:Trehalose operon repressor n=1 Tax=Aerococcus kribbianus TaxID=2999064 RepID=A0A9X3FNQ7_9LACT|nr:MULTISPECIES: trehalose operon repressor [unclassified Aerococcus]MCZ0717928.1 trehalose operon repressor [Aerococcus sp. YH-aer221]MCZ0726215.1 trehalose operon repressor [Aerococcus sp. YH-aer222]